ncbi:hypothetical protein IV102_07085 [bacterium]|nr:hypothetical protein [bacterium]
MMQSRRALTAIVLFLWVGWLSPAQADPQVHYCWTYTVGEEEKILQKGEPLPGDARLCLRVKVGPVPVQVLVFNSHQGETPRTQLPGCYKVEAHQELYLPWTAPQASAKAYVAFLEPGSAEAIGIQARLKEWRRLIDTSGDFSRHARDVYKQVVLWKAEDKGAAVVGMEQHEVGAARPGPLTRGSTLELPPPPPAPPGWPKSARVLTWKTGQHPVVISRFASKSR